MCHTEIGNSSFFPTTYQHTSKPAKSNELSNVIFLFQNDLVWLFMPLQIYSMMCTKLYRSSTPLEGTVANTTKKRLRLSEVQRPGCGAQARRYFQRAVLQKQRDVVLAVNTSKQSRQGTNSTALFLYTCIHSLKTSSFFSFFSSFQLKPLQPLAKAFLFTQ